MLKSLILEICSQKMEQEYPWRRIYIHRSPTRQFLVLVYGGATPLSLSLQLEFLLHTKQKKIFLFWTSTYFFMVSHFTQISRKNLQCQIIYLLFLSCNFIILYLFFDKMCIYMFFLKYRNCKCNVNYILRYHDASSYLSVLYWWPFKIRSHVWGTVGVMIAVADVSGNFSVLDNARATVL